MQNTADQKGSHRLLAVDGTREGDLPPRVHELARVCELHCDQLVQCEALGLAVVHAALRGGPSVGWGAERRRLLSVARSLGLDVAVIERSTLGCPKRLVAFDADSTLVDGEGIDELAIRAHRGPQVAALTARAMEGGLDYRRSLRARVELLQGLSAECVRDAVGAMRLNRGAHELCGVLRRHGMQLGVLSGGFDVFLQEICRRLPIGRSAGNRLEIVDGQVSGRLCGPVVDGAAKADRLGSWMDELGIAADAVVAVGDGANDVAMLRAAGVGLGFRPKAALLDVADGVIWSGDLRSVAGLLGIFEPEAPVRDAADPTSDR